MNNPFYLQMKQNCIHRINYDSRFRIFNLSFDVNYLLPQEKISIIILKLYILDLRLHLVVFESMSNKVWHGNFIYIYFIKGLIIETTMGRMPFVDIIYQKADDETKKNLKLTCKTFWACHVNEKFLNNFARSQERRHRQLYCCNNCPNQLKYEVWQSFLFLLNLARNASNQSY